MPEVDLQTLGERAGRRPDAGIPDRPAEITNIRPSSLRPNEYHVSVLDRVYHQGNGVYFIQAQAFSNPGNLDDAAQVGIVRTADGKVNNAMYFEKHIQQQTNVQIITVPGFQPINYLSGLVRWWASEDGVTAWHLRLSYGSERDQSGALPSVSTVIRAARGSNDQTTTGFEIMQPQNISQMTPVEVTLTRLSRTADDTNPGEAAMISLMLDLRGFNGQS